MLHRSFANSTPVPHPHSNATSISNSASNNNHNSASTNNVKNSRNTNSKTIDAFRKQLTTLKDTNSGGAKSNN